MCGIVGILSFDDRKRVEPALLEAMRDTMTHRGPDGEGLWVSPQGRIGLGHRRLAIIDLSDAARQPMTNADESVWVTFNGEIYNHMALRRQLEQAGHRFRTDHSDTEVLVHGYSEWGMDGLLERLDGMFAFALWDARRTLLILARDRVGIKPVYFTRTNGAFLFASEIKALMVDDGVPRDMEPAAMNHYLSFMIAPAPLTMFKDVFKLPAGHLMQVDSEGRVKARRYWNAVPGKSGGDGGRPGRGGDDAEEEKVYAKGVRDRLEAAIEKRMMSDVPFGVFLSGGIDSSANVALMSGMMDRPVDTFTVGYKDHPHLNELDYAAKVSRQFMTNHHEVLIDEKDMTGYLDDLVHHQDEPIADWVCVPLYFVSKLAKEAGITVVQVGEGSDEQFCGYDSYRMYLTLHRLFWRHYGHLPGPLRKALAAMARTITGTTNPRLDHMADILTRSARGQELFWGGAHAFWNIHKDRILQGAITGGPWPLLEEAGLANPALGAADSGAVIGGILDEFDGDHADQDMLTRMIHAEFAIRLPELLLMRVDKITMSTSVEGRVPFLDHGLVDYTMDIPSGWKLRNGESKYILKKALAGLLPDDILYRKKMGFGAPMAQWLRGDFGRQAEDTVLKSNLMERGYFNKDVIAAMFKDHFDERRDNALHLWILFNLTAWHDKWVG